MILIAIFSVLFGYIEPRKQERRIQEREYKFREVNNTCHDRCGKRINDCSAECHLDSLTCFNICHQKNQDCYKSFNIVTKCIDSNWVL